MKIAVSYEEPWELKEVLERLGPIAKSYKIAKRQQGRFKKAYIVGDITCCPIPKPEKT